MSKNVKVSMIITTYKGSDCIKRAIESLLAQTYKQLEIIIVDDNNPNSLERKQTEKICESYQIRGVKYLKHNENSNGAAARNTGIKMATGEYIGFLDDDDYYLPTKIELCVDKLDKHKNYDAVFCGVIITDNKYISKIINPQIDEIDTQKKLLFNINMFGTGSNLFFRKKVFDEIGTFDVSYYRLQDLEYLIRFFESHQGCSIYENLIVKARSIANNLPQYEKLFFIKQKFYKDFEKVLSKLNNTELNAFYLNEYSRLLQSCYGQESSENLMKAKKDLQKYRELTIKENISIILSLLGKPKSNAYILIRNITSTVYKPFKSYILKKKYNLNVVLKK